LLLAAPLPALATPFVAEIASLTAGDYGALALDAAGNPHIVFRAGDFPVYVTRRAGVWMQETIEDPFFDAGAYCSIALEASGRPHVCYYNTGNLNLRYATRNGTGNGGNWTAETVDAPGGVAVGQHTSIAVSAAGTVHISYWDATNTSLKYARGKAGSWSTIETVDNAASVGQYTSLALDEHGDAHIAYYDATNSAVKYARHLNGVWTSESIAVGDAGGHISLALDSQGFAIVSYYDLTLGALRLATRTGPSAWTLETVHDVTTSVQYTSLALDASDNPRIAYYLVSSSELWFASRSGTTWTTEVVDGQTRQIGTYASLALDPQGNPKIAYRDVTGNDLLFADASVRLVSPVGGEIWPTHSRQTVRWAGEGSVSLLLSVDGGASYQTLVSGVTAHEVELTAPAFETAEARLRVSRSSPLSVSDSPGFFSIARGLSSPWWSEVVDFSVPAGDFSALALDPDGRPSIAYFLGGVNDLWFATRNGDSWIREMADGTSLNSGTYNSLAIDELGNPHISTFDNDDLNLRYVTLSGGV